MIKNPASASQRGDNNTEAPECYSPQASSAIPLYKVRDWDAHFENSKSRERDRCSWCPIPNKQDGLGYGLLLAMENGAALYGAFVAVILTASKQRKPRLGYLTDTGRPNGNPLTARQLSVKTKIPADTIEAMLSAVSSSEIDWVERVTQVPAECPDGARQVPAECLGREGKEGKAGKGIPPGEPGESVDPSGSGSSSGKREKASEKKIHPEAKSVLQVFRSVTSRDFRDTDTNLALISARLSEPGVTVEGVGKMIKRQMDEWRGTQFEQYVCPDSLFSKRGFNKHYPNRDLDVRRSDGPPSMIQPSVSRSSSGRPDRNAGTLNAGTAEQYDLSKIEANRKMQNSNNGLPPQSARTI